MSKTTTANSLGHQLSHSAQLDGHFRLCQDEYVAMARAVGIQPGWHVLDAGCGVGSFLPLLAELVGTQGQVTAVDVAPENVERARQLVTDLGLSETVTVMDGDITRMRFDDRLIQRLLILKLSSWVNIQREFAGRGHTRLLRQARSHRQRCWPVAPTTRIMATSLVRAQYVMQR